MNQLQQLIAENEKWLKELVLEYAQAPDAASRWSDFFARLIASVPESPGPAEPLDLAFKAVRQPILVLNEEHVIVWQNPAAADLLGGREGRGLAGVAPWLVEGVEKECARKRLKSGIAVDIVRPGKGREWHYAVALSFWEGGCVLVLNDISHKVEAQQQLIRERNRSALYLDVVGSLVVALDASGAVTMANQATCRALDCGVHELIGRGWVEAVVPEEQREEVLDYFYLVYSSQVEAEDEYYYPITTREGGRRLILWQHKLLTNESDMPIGVLCSGTDVTEQRASEEALAEKELWLRSTFVALGEAVLILTPEWKVIDANPAAETVFGMANADLVDTPAEELHVDPAHHVDFKEKCSGAFAERKRIMLEYPMRRRNGEVFPSEQSASLIIGDDGHPLGIVNTIRDISSRKRAERVLQESEEKFRRIFESIEEGYMVTDMEGHVQMVNPATCRLFGYSREELVGKTVADLILDEGGEYSPKRFLANEEAIRGLQVRVVRKDGEIITVDGNAHVLRDGNGNPVGMEGTFRDITRQIEAEKVLSEREQQYRAFFENNHAIMLLTDPKSGIVVDANPAASEFYGFSREVMRTMHIAQISVQDEVQLFREMELACAEKRSYFVFQHILADHTIRDVEVYSGPIMVHGRQLLYSVIHDVTNRVRLENEMKALATTDALTGVDNRHQFFCEGSKELRRALRYKKPLSLLMLDIDYFKSINDTFGHQAGDEVLRDLARAVSRLLRESDVFGRLGGEEFAVALPETGLKLGLDVAERLRSSLAETVVVVEGKEISYTVSIGVTLARRSDGAIEDVIKRADEALYKAKRMGRNRVERA